MDRELHGDLSADRCPLSIAPDRRHGSGRSVAAAFGFQDGLPFTIVGWSLAAVVGQPLPAAAAAAVAGRLDGLDSGGRAHLGTRLCPPPGLLPGHLFLLVDLPSGESEAAVGSDQRGLMTCTHRESSGWHAAARQCVPVSSRSTSPPLAAAAAIKPRPPAHLAVGHHGAGRRQYKHELAAVVVLGIRVLLSARRLHSRQVGGRSGSAARNLGTLDSSLQHTCGVLHAKRICKSGHT